MKQVIPRITVILIISISMVLLFFIGWTFIDSGGGSSVSAKEFQPLLKDEGIRVTLPPMKPGYLSELYAQKKYRAIISSHNKSGARQRKSLKNRYIVGMSYYRLKQYSKAIKSFQPIANDKNPVAEWVYYYLSASYHFMGEHQKALGFLKKIRTEYPDSPFLDRALEIEGKTFLLLKKNQELIDSYNPLIKKSGDRVKSRLHYFLGLANESLKKKTRAAAHYRKVLEMSGNTYKGLCLKRLRVLIPRLEKSLSKSELLGTARYHLRRTKSRRQKKQGALLALKTLGYISGKSSDSTEYNKMLLMATSQERLNRITQAQKTYQAMLSRFSASSRYQMLGQYHYARFMFKRNPRKSYDMLKKIIHTPGHPSHAEACDLIERYKLSWSVDFDKRLVPIAFSQEKYRLVDRIMMRWIASKKYREFISFFSTVTDSNRFPAYTVKVKYWLGMSALQLGKRDIAIKHFKDAFLTYNRTYYSYRALDRLRALLKGDPDAIYRVLEENQRNKNRLISSKQYQLKYQSLIRQFDFAGLDDKNFRKAYYLMSFGEIFHGYKAFLTYLSSLGGDRPRHFAVIARMFHSMGLHQFSIRYSDFLNKHLNGKNGRNHLLDPFRQSSYPENFMITIKNMAKKYKVDPYLVLAIIREESRFFPSATSFSGAMGLMQIMPRTGRWLMNAKRNQRVNFYDNSLNISLGTKYLSSLTGKLTLPVALASYNGGPTRVKRIKTQVSKKVKLLDDDHLVELIDIDETRNYVKKVMTSYYNYKEIYK